jgi:hypothetical protein
MECLFVGVWQDLVIHKVFHVDTRKSAKILGPEETESLFLILARSTGGLLKKRIIRKPTTRFGRIT